MLSFFFDQFFSFQNHVPLFSDVCFFFFALVQTFVHNYRSAVKDNTLHSKKYGVDCIRFTHAENGVLTAPSPRSSDTNIRYLSLYDNKYLRVFSGHANRVVDISVSPIDDTFLSAGMDQSVRYWDLRTNKPNGVLRFPAPLRPSVAYDPLGLVFAAVLSPGVVKLYDSRKYDMGPFATFTLPPDALHTPQQIRERASVQVEISRTKFSADGHNMLLTGMNGRLLVIDAFDGHIKSAFQTTWGSKTLGLSLEASFTPDAAFGIVGSEEGKIFVFEVNSGELVCEWSGHTSPTACALWNPKYCCAASACSSLALW
jgi:COMPASS component SWD2